MQKRRRNKPLSDINVVPYIDVMLVLLVLFMVTAPLLSQGVKVDLPAAQAQPLSSDTPEPIIVPVDKNGNYYLNTAAQPEQSLSLPELAGQVTLQLQQDKARDAAVVGRQRQVLVKGDKNVDYGRVVQVMVALKNAGAAAVGLMTQEDATTVESSRLNQRQ